MISDALEAPGPAQPAASRRRATATRGVDVLLYTTEADSGARTASFSPRARSGRVPRAALVGLLDAGSRR